MICNERSEPKLNNHSTEISSDNSVQPQIDNDVAVEIKVISNTLPYIEENPALSEKTTPARKILTPNANNSLVLTVDNLKTRTGRSFVRNNSVEENSTTDEISDSSITETSSESEHVTNHGFIICEVCKSENVRVLPDNEIDSFIAASTKHKKILPKVASKLTTKEINENLTTVNSLSQQIPKYRNEEQNENFDTTKLLHKKISSKAVSKPTIIEEKKKKICTGSPFCKQIISRSVKPKFKIIEEKKGGLSSTSNQVSNLKNSMCPSTSHSLFSNLPRKSNAENPSILKETSIVSTSNHNENSESVNFKIGKFGALQRFPIEKSECCTTAKTIYCGNQKIRPEVWSKPTRKLVVFSKKIENTINNVNISDRNTPMRKTNNHDKNFKSKPSTIVTNSLNSEKQKILSNKEENGSAPSNLNSLQNSAALPFISSNVISESNLDSGTSIAKQTANIEPLMENSYLYSAPEELVDGSNILASSENSHGIKISSVRSLYTKDPTSSFTNSKNHGIEVGQEIIRAKALNFIDPSKLKNVFIGEHQLKPMSKKAIEEIKSKIVKRSVNVQKIAPKKTSETNKEIDEFCQKNTESFTNTITSDSQSSDTSSLVKVKVENNLVLEKGEQSKKRQRLIGDSISNV